MPNPVKRQSGGNLEELPRNEKELLALIRPEALPRHVAVIMDGNGRWAAQRGLPRSAGHRAGIETLRRIVELCGELGIPILSAYAFSTENWRRPPEEVNFLMNLFIEYATREIEELRKKGVKVKVIGCRSELPPAVLAAAERLERETALGERLLLNLAVNYGARREIVDAVRAIARKVRAGELDPEEIDEDTVAAHLYTAGLPDPDLLIRPAGEMRVSNFLLWQLAYTELYVTPVFWPDFSREDFLQALVAYQRRERRFGGLKMG
ncbi:isoprenyl transferase [Ammonifex thiophilus]|uniref:Isoprenyl transferase n=1 Tax=Ammonifex thiophilus TaxID=444093 RepID=A0A3D8P444_9THEO|nr:isoprenyl transferase [Ammonifex thiophilus]RDV82429.1 isoprenyl transferase [Ammonifex thiophilus]